MAKKKTLAGQMRAPAMEKLGEESGTIEGYGAAAEADKNDGRPIVKNDPGPKSFKYPDPGNNVGTAPTLKTKKPKKK